MSKVKRRSVYPYRTYAAKTSGASLNSIDYLDLFSALKDELSLALEPSDPRSAIVKAREEYVVLYIDKVGSDYVYGQIAYARPDAWPRILRTDGSIISLTAEGYVYEPTHFALFPIDKLLLVEYNHYGPRTGMLQSYIQTKTSDLSSIIPLDLEYLVFRQLLRRDQFEILRHSSSIASFEIEIATDAEIIVEGDLDKMLYDILPNAREYKVAFIRLAFLGEKYARKGTINITRDSIINFVYKYLPSLKLARVKLEPQPDGRSRLELVDLLAGKYAEIAKPALQGQSIVSSSMYEELCRIRKDVLRRMDFLSDETSRK